MTNKYEIHCVDCGERVAPKHGKLVKTEAGRWAASCTADVERKEAVAESRAATTTADINIPCPDGLAYLPYQIAGINYALKRTGVLFGDEMGLGKTIEAIGVLNADPAMKRVLVICPASLRLNWERELKRWLVRPMRISVAIGKQCDVDTSEVLIINYDIIGKHREKLSSVKWDGVIIDECHYLKNPKTKRTVAVLGDRDNKGLVEGATRQMFLSGTPIPNRPIEVLPVLKALGLFRGWLYFVETYCAGYRSRWGWETDGASNLDQLQSYMRERVMVRRLKADVLPELPAKRRQVVEIPPNGASRVVAAEAKAYEAHEEKLELLKAEVELAKADEDGSAYKLAVDRLREAGRTAFTEMSAKRHEVAMAKIPHVVEHVENAIGDSGKVVVFAHHKDMVAGLMELFGDRAVKLTGETPMLKRREAVDRFQTDPSIQVFIGNIQAAGVGITLTAASHVIFAELDWVPGNITQAEDRCHRIGQKDSVMVQHLVLAGSLDCRMAHTLIEKQEVIDRALDREEEQEPVLPRRKGARSDEVNGKVVSLTPEQINAIHEALRLLAEACDGAQALDGHGYNKFDTYIGKSLAGRDELSIRQAQLGRRIVWKYKRQLPDELMEVIRA